MKIARRFQCSDFSVETNKINSPGGIGSDYAGSGTVTGKVELVVVTGRTGKISFHTHAGIAFPVEYISLVPVAEYNEIFVPILKCSPVGSLRFPI